jgi:uncharacterized membrane protein YcaP (DUF421 family)
MVDLAAALARLLGEGVPATDLHWWQIGLRSLVIYLGLLVGVRLAKQRFMGEASAFDLIVVIILGAVAARGITGQIALVEVLAAIAVLLGLHWLLSWLCVRWPALDPWLKGRSHRIVGIDGRDRVAMRRHHLTDSDLHDAFRRQGCRDISEVECAFLERDGEVSVIVRRRS